jgi:glycosyltransferase involved in cell wall biosynthesis
VTDGSATSGSSRWIVIREGQNQRWGGELRRRQIFARLAERTGATVVEKGWYPVLLRRAARGSLGRLPGPLLYRLPSRGPRPRLAASEKLRDRLLDAAIAVTDPAAVAIYDDAAAQSRALGVDLDPGWLAELSRRQRRNIEAFRWLVSPTASFAELIGLPMDRVIVGGNGTDTTRIRVGPWPTEPAIGIVTGAAPSRGLEMLVEAVRLARGQIPGLRLRMWLVATSPESSAYLEALRASTAADPWLEISTASYAELGDRLATVSALCITQPPSDYGDVALPVKLFDSLAAGRPLLVTPRTETAAVIERTGAGMVARGDRAEDFAAAITELVSDEGRARLLGGRARLAAESEFDWRVVGERIARELLAREGGSPAAAPGLPGDGRT